MYLSKVQLITISHFSISAGSLIFPLSYMTIACITEIYGFKKTKMIIATGAVCNLFVAIYLYIVVKLPHATFWVNQYPFSKTIVATTNILLISTTAYIASEYLNAKVISKLKIFLGGKWLLARAIASTSTAAIVDSTLMLPIIFYYSSAETLSIYFSLIMFKILYEIILLPALWISVEFLRKKERLYKHEVQHAFSSVSYMAMMKKNS